MAQAGGFFPYSPAPSSVASSSATALLPHPRAAPLKPGGSKESTFIRYADQQLLTIQRKFAKRDAAPGTSATQQDELGRLIDTDEPMRKLDKSEQWQDVPGYKSFAEAAREVEALVGVTWVSGTRTAASHITELNAYSCLPASLQIPYLISIALLTSTMIPAFPASPRHLFRLLGKLDHAFASLLQGRDAETGDTLPGFPFGRKVSTTEKVRIKSLVERTRLAVTRIIAAGEFDQEDDPLTDENADGTDGDLVIDGVDDGFTDTGFEDWGLEVAKVYDKTLQDIGDSMDGPPIGIQTNRR
ncbi:hypothetical protein ANO11243_011060 [Dothideomycetidae sp. 11243]|nr:hypothetical protein ANO11243_011060 [fungal sp. No.11243]